MLVDPLASALAKRFEVLEGNIATLNEKIDALGEGVIASNDNTATLADSLQKTIEGVLDLGEQLPEAVAGKVAQLKANEGEGKLGIGDVAEVAANAIANPASLPLNIARKLLQQ